jgi:hypothetical protein
VIRRQPQTHFLIAVWTSALDTHRRGRPERLRLKACLHTSDLDAVAAAGDDSGEAIRFLCDHSVTWHWQQGSDNGSTAGWRLCVHPFLGSDAPLHTCLRLLRALAVLLTEAPRPPRLFHCRTHRQPCFESIASFSLADCATALEIVEHAQLPKVLHDRIVDNAAVSALGQVLCTPASDPTEPEGPSWHDQCCSLRSEVLLVGSLVRSVAALLPERLVTVTLARRRVSTHSSEMPTRMPSDTDRCVRRLLPDMFEAPLAAASFVDGNSQPWRWCRSREMLAGLWGRSFSLAGSEAAPVAGGAGE